jgi:hypothetical protein
MGVQLGILVAIAGYVGIKGAVDFAEGTKQAKVQFEKVKDDAVTDFTEQKKNANQKLDEARERAVKEITDKQAEMRRVQEEYEKLGSRLPELKQIAEDVRKLNDSVARQTDSFHELTTQVQTLAIQPLPAPSGKAPFRLPLDRVVKATTIQAIKESGKLVFHVAGNTGGVKRPEPQILVANAMSRQCQMGDPAERPAFLYLLGNIVYYNGEASEYYNQFYKPYLHYPSPIFAIPGNHDADPLRGKEEPRPSLAAFVDNFCSRIPHKTAEAGDASRMSMTQPNVYWTLETPYATIIGLYTNVPVGAGSAYPRKPCTSICSARPIPLSNLRRARQRRP